ncbi:cupin domain-containing protein [Paracoccus benzoatiresistens]|uniref:Cupin domain-containing protein n=1 Tax=Paracoccus benzoatiresistens TaxID=2997341 RepID=A0ABT4J1A6_9RHOB|nr:cupin domain-containing protein [Paracoccus sp. EF6]MCZ0960904.1 cupin domain-containing protein [Paracoccus sp. EF6]
MFVARLKLPANYRVPPHTHPVDEAITVISGEFNIAIGEEFDEGETTALTAGGQATLPTTVAHFAHTDQETVIQISARGPWGLNYINPEDKSQIME